MTSKKKKVGTLNYAPTWASILPMLLVTWREGKDQANFALSELHRMAELADKAKP